MSHDWGYMAYDMRGPASKDYVDTGRATLLRHAIEESLGFFATSNAVFLSEILVRGGGPNLRSKV